VEQVLASESGLAFDHSRILADGLERARSNPESTALAVAFRGKTSTAPELRQVYEAVCGMQLDREISIARSGRPSASWCRPVRPGGQRLAGARRYFGLVPMK
jgi:hypothetical protein